MDTREREKKRVFPFGGVEKAPDIGNSKLFHKTLD